MAFSQPPKVPNITADPTGTVWQRYWISLYNWLKQIPTSYTWANISSFVGSNLTQIVTRNHNDLQSIQGGAAAQYYHLTSVQSTNIGTFSHVAHGYDTLPSGLIVQWGIDTSAAGGTVITLPKPFPTAFVSVTATSTASATAAASIINTSSFTLYNSAGTTSNWIAIGY